MGRPHLSQGRIARCSRDAPDTGSNDRTLDMLLRFNMSSSLRGTLPPTRPVFPPWGTTPILRSRHRRIILLTCSVVCGRKTVVDFPRYFPIQSVLYWSISEEGIETGESVERMAFGGRNCAKWAMSSGVTGLRVCWAEECCHLLAQRNRHLVTALEESMILAQRENDGYPAA